GVRHATARGRESHHTAERRGCTHRATAVGAVADRDHAGGDRSPRATARAARAAVGCPWIARGSVSGGFGGRVSTQFGNVGAPDDDETGADEPVGEPTVHGGAVAGIFVDLEPFVEGLTGD